MSFILDALKKLEQERAARGKGTVDIADGILRDDYRARRGARSFMPWILIVGGVALILLLGAGGALVWRDYSPGGRMKHEGERPPVGGALPPQARKAVPSPPPETPSAVPKEKEFAAPPETPSPSPPVEQGEQSLTGVSPAGDFRTGAAQPSREVSVSNSGLKVSGVAWQEKPSDRRAVVNDTLVSEGSVVDGATVDEILPMRVRFSSGGRRFSVSISTSPRGK